MCLKQELCMILPQDSFRFRLGTGATVWLKNFVVGISEKLLFLSLM